jgi:hypothetical protein
LLHRNGWKKKIHRPHHPKRSIGNKLSIKKISKKLNATAVTFAEDQQTIFVVAFFEDEARFGRISREMCCWDNREMISSIAKQMIREYI